MVLSDYPLDEEVKNVAAQYADRDITRQDSLDAGNCETGTDDFIEGFLSGRTTVKVSELVKYIEDYASVRALLIYKFREWEAESVKAESEDTSEDK